MAFSMAHACAYMPKICYHCFFIVRLTFERRTIDIVRLGVNGRQKREDEEAWRSSRFRGVSWGEREWETAGKPVCHGKKRVWAMSADGTWSRNRISRHREASWAVRREYAQFHHCRKWFQSPCPNYGCDDVLSLLPLCRGWWDSSGTKQGECGNSGACLAIFAQFFWTFIKITGYILIVYIRWGGIRDYPDALPMLRGCGLYCYGEPCVSAVKKR